MTKRILLTDVEIAELEQLRLKRHISEDYREVAHWYVRDDTGTLRETIPCGSCGGKGGNDFGMCQLCEGTGRRVKK